MEHTIIIEFVPPNDEVKDVIFVNFSQIEPDDPADNLEQYKNLLSTLASYHPLVGYMFEGIFFNFSEFTLNLVPTDCGSRIRMEATTNQDVYDVKEFLSKFGTFLLLIDCELVSIKATGPDVTLVGYPEEDDADYREVLVCEEAELENILAAMRKGQVDETLYEGVELTSNGTGAYGNWFGFNEKLQFWIYPGASSILLQPVNRDLAHWSGGIQRFDKQKDAWTETEYEVFFENIENESERVIHFKCGEISFSAPAPLCLVSDATGDIRTHSINTSKDNLMDEEMEKILKDSGYWK